MTVYRLHPLMPDDFAFGGADAHAARARGPAGRARPAARSGWTRSAARPRPGRRSAPLPRARSSCTTTRARCSPGSGSAGCRRSTSRRRTSCARARPASRPTTRSGGCCGCRRRRPSRSSRAATTLHAREIRDLYGGDLEAVDAVVGLYGEPKPRGFAFSRDRVPDLPADGVAAAAERPLLHRRLHARGLHARRAAVDRGHVDGRRAAPPLPVAAAGARTRSRTGRDSADHVAPCRRRSRGRGPGRTICGSSATSRCSDCW